MKNIFILTIISLLIFACKGPTPEPGSEQIKSPDGALVIKEGKSLSGYSKIAISTVEVVAGETVSTVIDKHQLPGKYKYTFLDFIK